MDHIKLKSTDLPFLDLKDLPITFTADVYATSIAKCSPYFFGDNSHQ